MATHLQLRSVIRSRKNYPSEKEQMSEHGQKTAQSTQGKLSNKEVIVLLRNNITSSMFSIISKKEADE